MPDFAVRYSVQYHCHNGVHFSTLVREDCYARYDRKKENQSGFDDFQRRRKCGQEPMLADELIWR
jgi:hypothetical protein